MTGRMMSMAEALREAMRQAMRRNPSVFLLGEDLGVPGGFGGGFSVTLGLADEFGHDRVMDTPISETAIVGAAVGAAMVGMRPIAEMQYGDFVFCAMDQVVNQAAKMHYMSNGQVSVPLVLRLPVGATTRGALPLKSCPKLKYSLYLQPRYLSSRTHAILKSIDKSLL